MHFRFTSAGMDGSTRLDSKSVEAGTREGDDRAWTRRESERKHARHQRRGIAHHGGVPVSDRVVRARAEERETQRSKTTNDFEFAADGEAEQADVRGAEREGVLDAGEDEAGAVSVAGRETGDGLELGGGVPVERETVSVAHLTGRVGESVA